MESARRIHARLQAITWSRLLAVCTAPHPTPSRIATSCLRFRCRAPRRHCSSLSSALCGVFLHRDSRGVARKHARVVRYGRTKYVRSRYLGVRDGTRTYGEYDVNPLRIEYNYACIAPAVGDCSDRASWLEIRIDREANGSVRERSASAVSHTSSVDARFRRQRFVSSTSVASAGGIALADLGPRLLKDR